MGMSLAQVGSILGCKGEELSSNNIAGFRNELLMWQGRGSLGANMNLLFQNGNLVQKSQFGMR